MEVTEFNNNINKNIPILFQAKPRKGKLKSLRALLTENTI